MSKKPDRSRIAKARNSLRPFFNNRKLSYWKELQAVRQETHWTDLPALLRFAEENDTFPFPGLGNTFPRDPRLVPNPNFRGLKALQLSKELSIQVARLNHHEVRLVDALKSVARVNDALLTGDVDTAQTAIDEHKVLYGLTLALSKKELFLSLRRGGLPGLLATYKTLTSGKERTAWAVLCHYAYEVADPTNDPARAARNGMSVVRSMGQRRAWCTDIIESEALTTAGDLTTLARSLLRYGALSLTDLALLIWRAKHVFLGEPLMQLGFIRLNVRIRDTLEYNFSHRTFEVPHSYRLSREDPPDREIYRTSYFFDDIANIAVWRTFLSRGILKDHPEAFANKIVRLPEFMERAADAIISSPKISRVVAAELLDWETSVLNPPGAVTDQNMLCAVLAAESLRIIQHTHQTNPLELATLLATTKDLHLYINIEDLKRLLGRDPTVGSDLLQFLVRELIYRKSRTLDNELERRLAFMNLFTGGLRNGIVQELALVHATDPTIAILLAETCTRTFLERLYLLMTSVKDVIETRIEICDWLAETLPENNDSLKEERDALYRELSNLDARSDLDSTRVHVDEEALREWFMATQLPNITRYIQTLLAEGPAAEYVSLVEFYTKDRKQEDTEQEFTNETQVGSAFLLVPIVAETLRAFATDRTFGLDSYLSRRIRHGTLIGQIMTPVNRALKEWAEYEELHSLAHESGPSKAIDQVIAEWAKYLYAVLDNIRKEVIQIRSEAHPSGLIEATWNTPTNIQHLDAMIARVRQRIFEEKGAYDPFPDIYAFCWDCLEVDLAQLRYFMGHDFITAAASKLTDLFSALERDEKRISLAFLIDVNKTLVARIQEVCGWFIRPVFRRDKYDLGTLISTTLSIVRELDAKYAFSEKVTITNEISVNRGSFNVIGDALFVLVGNAARHGKVDGEISVSVGSSTEDGIVSIDVTSEMATLEGHAAAIVRINSALRLQDRAGVERAAVEEGFSGLRKLIGMFRRVRSPLMSFSFTNDPRQLEIGFRLVLPTGIAFGRE
jgi:hypothetical protein